MSEPINDIIKREVKPATDSGFTLSEQNFGFGNQSNLTQYLTFSLNHDEYGVDILKVQEIRSWEPVSRIPNVPPYEKGVINLRGAIVPIIDLRERFGLEFLQHTAVTAVIVLQTEHNGKLRSMGIVVDSVSNVVDVETAAIQDAPDFGARVNTQFIHGLAASNERMIMLLDVDKLMIMEGTVEPV